tara:strand:+ start:366 stop:641 length:276 start_codon:yes stop_codon:yes gene_type:complete
MRTTIIAFIFAAMIQPAWAGHSRNNGTCTDDAIHWQNMINKRSDAPLYEQSKAMQAKAMEKRVTGDHAGCEELMEEALRMIRKSGGQYPTE